MWFVSPNSSDYSSRRKNERDLKLDYFAHTVADLHRLPKRLEAEVLAELPSGIRTFVAEVDAECQLKPESEPRLDWGEIATLEDKVLSREEEAALRRRAWQIRTRYARLAGPDAFHAYMLSGPPDEKDPGVSIDELRADLRRLLAATHVTYNLALVRENNRRRVLKKLLQWGAGLCVPLLLIASWLMGWDPRLAGVIAVVAFFGCLGAYVSIQRRLQSTSDGGDPIIGILALHEFNVTLHFPLIAGGVFAVVLYFMIAAKLVEGTLFPDLRDTIPGDATGWGKLFIWSFVAGFAERFVPDTLDRLVNQAQRATAAMPAAAQAAAMSSRRPTTTTTTTPAKGIARRATAFQAKAPTPPPV